MTITLMKFYKISYLASKLLLEYLTHNKHSAEFKYISITAFTTLSKLNFPLYKNVECFTCTRDKVAISYIKHKLIFIYR